MSCPNDGVCLQAATVGRLRRLHRARSAKPAESSGGLSGTTLCSVALVQPLFLVDDNVSLIAAFLHLGVGRTTLEAPAPSAKSRSEASIHSASARSASRTSTRAHSALLNRCGSTGEEAA